MSPAHFPVFTVFLFRLYFCLGLSLPRMTVDRGRGGRPPQALRVAGESPLDQPPRNRCQTVGTELAFRGSNSPRSALTRRCWRRHCRDRRTSRRRFPPRSAGPHGVGDGSRPKRPPEALAAADSARAWRGRPSVARPCSALRWPPLLSRPRAKSLGALVPSLSSSPQRVPPRREL